MVRPVGRASDPQPFHVPERLAVRLGSDVPGALAPLRSRDNIRAVAEGIEAMEARGGRLLAGHGDPPADIRGASWRGCGSC